MYTGYSESYVCDYCLRTFTRKYNLLTHIENCHLNSTCTCHLCDMTFGSPSGLQLHLSRGHNSDGKPYPQCDICKKVFTRRQNIVSHMITVHLQGVGPKIKCYLCHKIFTTERNLKRHLNQLHNPDASYPTCFDCHRVFKSRSSLSAHVLAFHDDSGRGTNQCELCDKVYTNNRNLKRHVETCHGDKEDFRCELCPKVYSSNQSLRRHIRTNHENNDTNTTDHLDDKPQCSDDNDESSEDFQLEFSCTTCKAQFDFEPQLRKHVKTDHSFDAFYKYCKDSLLKQSAEIGKKRKVSLNCEFCAGVYDNVYELKEHMKMAHDREYCLSTCNVCYTRFFSKEAITNHRTLCFPPPDAHSCGCCDKLFTDITSLEFHTRIFHPQADVAVASNDATDLKDTAGSYMCAACDRMYYSRRSLKHHVKLKHTTNEAVDCKLCGKICHNKYYLSSHVKLVHNNDTWSKCDYCEKQFKTKRNIRRHIEFTHLGIQRYKCMECETLFKEKRSLRKHVRSKHPDSDLFPQCHICHKRFESAKSCKIHLKLIHSFNMNTFPCDLCSVSFGSQQLLSIHISTKHSSEDEIYKCKECNLVFNGQENFDRHTAVHPKVASPERKAQPRCVICSKDFSSMKTLKRHIKKFHAEFDKDDLANFGSKKRDITIECNNCLKYFSDEDCYAIYLRNKQSNQFIVFTCDVCQFSCDCLEFAVQRYKMNNFDKSKAILSEFCTTEMSDHEESNDSDAVAEFLQSDSFLTIKPEPSDYIVIEDSMPTEDFVGSLSETVSFAGTFGRLNDDDINN